MAEIKALSGEAIQLTKGSAIPVEIVYGQEPTKAVIFVEEVVEYLLEQNVHGSIYREGALGEIAFFYCSFGENGIKREHEPLPTIIKALDDPVLIDKARDSYFNFLRIATESKAQREHDMKALFAERKWESVV